MDNTHLKNISIIDKQQQFFLSILKGELKQTHDPTHEQMHLLLNKLEEYLVDLFKMEEDCIDQLITEKYVNKDSEFENLKIHKQQHSFFIQRINETRLGLTYNNKLLYLKLINFMKKWYLTHILQYDKTLKIIIDNYLNNLKKQNEAN